MWTRDEHERLRALVAKSEKWEVCAASLGRSISSCINYATRTGIHNPRPLSPAARAHVTANRVWRQKRAAEARAWGIAWRAGQHDIS